MEKTRPRLSMMTMYLGLAAVLIPLALGLLMTAYRYFFDKASLNSGNTGLRMGFGPGMLALILSIPAIISGIRALKKGERSWILWTGFIPAILVCGFIMFFIIGEIIYPH